MASQLVLRTGLSFRTNNLHASVNDDFQAWPNLTESPRLADRLLSPVSTAGLHYSTTNYARTCSDVVSAAGEQPISPVRYQEDTTIASGSRAFIRLPSRRANVVGRINGFARSLRVWPSSRPRQVTKAERGQILLIDDQDVFNPGLNARTRTLSMRRSESSREMPCIECNSPTQHVQRSRGPSQCATGPSLLNNLNDIESQPSRADDESPPSPEYQTVNPRESESPHSVSRRLTLSNPGLDSDDSGSVTSYRWTHNSIDAESSTSSVSIPPMPLLSPVASWGNVQSPSTANPFYASSSTTSIVSNSRHETSDAVIPTHSSSTLQPLETPPLPVLRMPSIEGNGCTTHVIQAPSPRDPPEREIFSFGVYQTTFAVVQDVMSSFPSEELSRQCNALLNHAIEVSGLDLIGKLVHSHDYRLRLLDVAGLLGQSNNPDLRKAVQEDEVDIAKVIHWMSTSDDHRGTMLALDGDSAQKFLDVVQDVLDRGLLVACGGSAKVRRLLSRLSEQHKTLPSCFFITGVKDCDTTDFISGGFGDVFKASYKGNAVALKRIRCFHNYHADRSRGRKKFFQEALVWKHLAHPHIVPFLGIDDATFPSHLCLVSLWMRHGTVLKHLKDCGRANINKTLFEVVNGLAHLHSMDIIHGDLRGANILINDNGEACLTDFGLTVFQDATAGTSNRHAGSVRWMAPELLAPDRFGLSKSQLTQQSDIYSLACVCLELFTANPPFPHIKEPIRVAFAVVSGERPGRPVSPSMPDAIWEIVQRCWCGFPEARMEITEITRILRRLVHQPELGPLASVSLTSPSSSSPLVPRHNTQVLGNLNLSQSRIPVQVEAERIPASSPNASQGRSSMGSPTLPEDIQSWEAIAAIISSEQLIFENTLKVLFTAALPSIVALSRIRSYVRELVALDPISRLVQSRKYRKELFMLAEMLQIGADSKLRRAVQQDEDAIAELVQQISKSEVQRQAILALDGDSAQSFLDIVQDVLDRGLLIHNDDDSRRIRRFLIRLCERCLMLVKAKGQDHSGRLKGRGSMRERKFWDKRREPSKEYMRSIVGLYR